MLIGELVTLRPVQRLDISYFLKWFNDPDVIQYTGVYLPLTEMKEEKFIEELGTSSAATTTWFIIEVVESDAKKPIGAIVLNDINVKDHCARFAIVIGEKPFWSKGCGTEAAKLIIRYGFEQLNLRRISSGVWSFNERSLRLHIKVGFSEEGRCREVVYVNGSYHDEVLFGLLREDWEKLK